MLKESIKKNLGNICKEVAIKGVNSSCWYCFHKVEIPKELNRYRKR